METLIQPKMTFVQKTQIYKDVKLLDFSESAELFKIIQKNTDKYTTNKNGAFINMRNLDNKTLWKISKFINYCKKTKEALQISEIKRQVLLENTILNKNSNKIQKKKEDSKVQDDVIEDSYDIYNLDDNSPDENIVKEEIHISLPELTIYKPKYVGVVGRILKKCREIDKNEVSVYGIYVDFDPNKYNKSKNTIINNDTYQDIQIINKDIGTTEVCQDDISHEIMSNENINEDSNENSNEDSNENSNEDSNDEYMSDDLSQDEDTSDEETETFQQDCDIDNSDDDIN